MIWGFPPFLEATHPTSAVGRMLGSKVSIWVMRFLAPGAGWRTWTYTYQIDDPSPHVEPHVLQKSQTPRGWNGAGWDLQYQH